METITIKVDSEIAKAYQQANTDKQKKINLLLGMWLKEIITDQTSLEEIMNKCSEEVKENGLTPEILESLLQEK